MEREIVTTPEAFTAFGEKLLETLPKKDTAIVIALEGDLGAGKTTFTQALAGILGVTEHVVSPTFMIMRSYDTKHDQFTKLVHIDAYRIENEEELSVLKVSELLEDPNTIMCIEWAERVPTVVPADALHVKINIAEDNTRTVTYGTKD